MIRQREHWPPSRGPACCFGRDHLQDEKRLPVEPTARRVSRRLLGTPDLPEWIELGVLDLIWESLIERCEELGGVDFEWQAADGAMGKARFGATR